MVTIFENTGNLLFGIISRIGDFESRIENKLSQLSAKVTKVFNEITETVNNFFEPTYRVLQYFTDFMLKFSELLPFILIVLIQYAYEDGDKESLEFILSDFLGLKPISCKKIQSYRLMALWHLIKRSPNWMLIYKFDIWGMQKYLAFSVNRRAYHLIHQHNKEDSFDHITNDSVYENFTGSNSNNNPLNILIEKEKINELKNFLIRNISETKYELENKIVSLLLHGYSIKDCVEVLNCNYNDITTFKRRLERRMKKVC